MEIEQMQKKKGEFLDRIDDLVGSAEVEERELTDAEQAES